MPAQLILPMGVEDAPGIDNFIDKPNTVLLAHLKRRLTARVRGESDKFSGVYLWGEADSGKSHLLVAMSQWVEQSGGASFWLKPGNIVSAELTDASSHQVYLLDDVEEFTTTAEDEREFLTLIERIKQKNSMLVITASQAVKGLKIGLPDLYSRLQALESFQLHALADSEKCEVLRQRAKQRGIVLGDDVINWLLAHTSRELGMLLNLLEQIDVQSLAQKRRVTIPLIKTILAERS